MAMGQAAVPSAPYASKAWAALQAVEVAGGPTAGLGPHLAVGMQDTVLVTRTLWDIRVFKRILSAVRWQRGS